MKIRIEDGRTIISTGVGNDVVRNKTGVRGLSYREDMKCFTLAITVDGKKYHIGNYDTLEEGKAMRKLADEMIANGTFQDWLHDLKMKRKERPGSRRFKQNKSEGEKQG